ncbi:MAG: hypothetical protein IJ748_05420, partial [Bacteroidales bacterium]|nr:hypothetical protein [Bacteroidales bacterium]
MKRKFIFFAICFIFVLGIERLCAQESQDETCPQTESLSMYTNLNGSLTLQWSSFQNVLMWEAISDTVGTLEEDCTVNYWTSSMEQTFNSLIPFETSLFAVRPVCEYEDNP